MPLLAFAAASGFSDKGYMATVFVITYVGLFAPALLLVTGENPFLRTAFQVIWWPSVLAGLLTAYSSANGAMNAGLGMFPAAILGLAGLAFAAGKGWDAWKAGPASRAVVLAAPAVFVLWVLLRWCTNTYRESSVDSLVHAIQSGPYAGLSTTSDTRDFMREIEADIRGHESANGRLVVYYEAPGVYLFSRMRPAVGTLWLVPNVENDLIGESFRQMNKGQGLAIKMLDTPGPPVGPLAHAIENPERLIRQAHAYAIYSLPAPPTQ